MGDNRGPQLEGVVLSFFILCFITVSLRSYTMGFILKRFYLEDYLAILALLIYISFATLALISIGHGLGKHEEDVAPTARPIATKYCFLAAVVYIALSYLVKVIVGLFLVRICSASHQKWQRISIWTMLVVVGLFYGAYFFIAIFACQPVEYVWTRDDPVPPTSGQCNPSVAATSISYIATVLNCVADWMLAILPATVVWKARLDSRTKISICVILAIGSIASIATIIRVFYAKELVQHDDYLYEFTPLATWSTIEVGTALTASSLATLKPLFRKFTAIFSTTRTSSSYGPQSGQGSRKLYYYGRQSGRRMSAAVSAKRQSSLNGGASYATRKVSLPSSNKNTCEQVTISLPIQARWHYRNCSDEIEMVPGSPSSGDLSPGSRKAVYFKRWADDDDDMV